MDTTETIANALRAEGVEYLFGFPSNPLLDTGAAEDAGIRTIVVRQERTGVSSTGTTSFTYSHSVPTYSRPRSSSCGYF